MNDLEAFEESSELQARKFKYSWALLGAVGAFLGVGYVGWSLTAPTTAEAAPAPDTLARDLGGANESPAISGDEEAAAPSIEPLAVQVEPTTEPMEPGPGDWGAPRPGASDENEEGYERISTPIIAGERAAEDEQAENGVPVEYATDGSFYVQVASYRSKENAGERAAELTEKKLPAQSFAYGGPTAGWWHAVRLGPFDNRADAEASRFKLEPSERRQSYVLPRSNGKFHVQVASFATAAKAAKVAKKFAVQGHNTKISRVRMAGKRWYCVRIGPFDSREEAVGYQKLVRDIPGGKSEVIPFPPAPKR